MAKQPMRLIAKVPKGKGWGSIFLLNCCSPYRAIVPKKPPDPMRIMVFKLMLYRKSKWSLHFDKILSIEAVINSPGSYFPVFSN